MRIPPAQAVGCVNQEGLDQSLGSKITHTFKSGTDKARPTITVVLEDPFSRNLELLLAGERDQRRRLAGDRVLFPLFVRRHTSVDRRGLHAFLRHLYAADNSDPIRNQNVVSLFKLGSAQSIECELKLDATSWLLPLSHAGALRPGMLPPPA